MKSLDEYKDFSEHECPFCKGIDINMKYISMILLNI